MRMPPVLTVTTAEAAAALPAGSIAALGLAQFRARPPLAHLAQLDDTEALAARCSIWRRLDAQGHETDEGLIGHFAASEGDAGAAAAAAVLQQACSALRRHGCRRVIGPLDGSTWHRYRFLTDRGNEPPFFLEPDNPDAWPDHFRAQKFRPIAAYTSALNEDLAVVDPRTEERTEALGKRGVVIRTLDPTRLDQELDRLYQMSSVTFVTNYLYSPIDRDAFLAMYQPLRDHLVPELIHLAEAESELIGYMFGLPDLNEAGRGTPVQTVILKTVAVHPAWAGHGLGAVLVDRCQRSAYRLGYRRAIHALMYEGNRSRNISGRSGHTMRRYTLFARELG